jgi:hypothetical protein
MKEQTAVEWLIARFHYEGFIGTFCSEEQIKAKRDVMIEIIEQAKEMEKEQISIAYKEGWNCPHGEGFPETGEQYYNETFNKSIKNKG